MWSHCFLVDGYRLTQQYHDAPAPPPLKRVSIAPAVAKWAVLTEEDTVYSTSIVCLFSLVYYVALPSAQQMK